MKLFSEIVRKMLLTGNRRLLIIWPLIKTSRRRKGKCPADSEFQLWGVGQPLMNNDGPKGRKKKNAVRMSDSTLRLACVSKSNTSLKDEYVAGTGLMEANRAVTKYPLASTIIQSIWCQSPVALVLSYPDETFFRSSRQSFRQSSRSIRWLDRWMDGYWPSQRPFALHTLRRSANAICSNVVCHVCFHSGMALAPWLLFGILLFALVPFYPSPPPHQPTAVSSPFHFPRPPSLHFIRSLALML